MQESRARKVRAVLCRLDGKNFVECMSKKTGEMRPEYDFSKGVRGKHAKAMQEGHTTIVHKTDGSVAVRQSHPIILEPDLQVLFPTSEAVNKALRSLVKADFKLMQ